VAIDQRDGGRVYVGQNCFIRAARDHVAPFVVSKLIAPQETGDLTAGTAGAMQGS